MSAEFFVDENDLALGRALDAEHGDVVYPGHADIPEVPRGSLDDEWMPIVEGEPDGPWMRAVTESEVRSIALA